MFKNYLQGIEGIATYPLFSLVVFFLFFLIMGIWVMKSDTSSMQDLASMPLNDNSEQQSEKI
ncbi:MAG TPA: CcoQ/FixQ family Cbb3-type cytochrome c oxidase assembly chaperone [Bacteroidia bacterium]|nr:CcoQ/FixQ family Cbb3-type cytochrome c oxidase assembly chaperone [Bacteroidia bacterium]HNP98479.1 CcoQ/FixQ family Cbb3-type cytochrome c oxidase assembly chaperone [Bacteroidia bacterium]